jgi:hypothetical protein
MGCDHLVGASPTQAMVGWPGSWQAIWLSNRPGRNPATKAALGGRANRRAITCVKPEQASRGSAWTSTQPKDGEDSMVWGSSRQMHPSRSTGVRGTARRDRGSRKRLSRCRAAVAKVLIYPRRRLSLKLRCPDVDAVKV